MAFDATRGSWDEYCKARSYIYDFEQSIIRQHPDYAKDYGRVEVFYRCTRPFFNKRYTEWLGIHQKIWINIMQSTPPPPLTQDMASMKDRFIYTGSYTGSYTGRYNYNPLWRYNRSYSSYSSDIKGLKADMVIIDDPVNIKGKKVKIAKPKTYNTVGVRFLRGHNLAKVYTYKVPKKTKLGLGEEVIVPSAFDGLTTNGIAVVVELHREPQDTTFGIDYKFVTGRIARIAQ